MNREIVISVPELCEMEGTRYCNHVEFVEGRATCRLFWRKELVRDVHGLVPCRECIKAQVRKEEPPQEYNPGIIKWGKPYPICNGCKYFQQMSLRKDGICGIKNQIKHRYQRACKRGFVARAG